MRSFWSWREDHFLFLLLHIIANIVVALQLINSTHQLSSFSFLNVLIKHVTVLCVWNGHQPAFKIEEMKTFNQKYKHTQCPWSTWISLLF